MDLPAAEEAVHLGAAEGDAVLRRRGNVPQRHRLAAGTRDGNGKRPLAGRYFLFHQGVPFPAGGALAHPLGVFVSAVRAEPNGLRRFRRTFHSHLPSIFAPLRYKKKILFQLGTISHRDDVCVKAYSATSSTTWLAAAITESAAAETVESTASTTSVASSTAASAEQPQQPSWNCCCRKRQRRSS